MSDQGNKSGDDQLLRAWCDALLAELSSIGEPDQGASSLADAEVDIDSVLGLAGVVAHAVVRPAAPLTAYVVGLAVGRMTSASPEGGADAFAAAASCARSLATRGGFAPVTPEQ